MELERWLVAEFDDLAETDHLIVVEHPQFAGLPWHAVDGARWTTSYAPSWSALLALGEQCPPRRLGVLTAATADDDEHVHAAFAASTATVQAICDRVGVEITTIAGAAADRTALERLLTDCDAALLQCHGFVAAEDREVALMLSAGGEPPLQHAVAAASPAMAAHRYSWREAQRLPRAPALVLSAACSSGFSHASGLGDRLGFFGALLIARHGRVDRACLGR